MTTLKRTILGLTAALLVSTATYAQNTVSSHDTQEINALCFNCGHR